MDDSAEVPLILQGNEKLLFEQEEQDEMPFPLPIQVIPSSEFFIWVNSLKLLSKSKLVEKVNVAFPS